MTNRLSKNNRFSRIVNESNETLPKLPFVHSTDVYLFQEIAEKGEVYPQECPYYVGEYLTYLFYGRPLFRPNSKEIPNGLQHYLPVCLIFNPDMNANIKRIYPFDSGAFHEGYYSRYMHKKMIISDFELELDHSTPGRVISLFFGSVDNYLSGAPSTPGVNLDPVEFEANSYLAIITAKDSNELDNRGSGIEIQTEEALNISEHLMAVILPGNFMDSRLLDSLKSSSIDIIPYKTYGRMKPSEYTSEIMAQCRSYYIHKGLVAKE